MRTWVLVLALLAGCEVDGADEIGSTALAVLLNPLANEGHVGTVPDNRGDDRGGITVSADPGGSVVTDNEGLATVETDVGTVRLGVGSAHVEFEVEADGDLLDLALAYDGSTASLYPGLPHRYSAGAGAIYVEAGTSVAELEELLAEDDVVVVLRPGTWTGDLAIEGSRVDLVAEGFTRHAVVLQGTLNVRGADVRLRGLTLDGPVTATADGFSASFSVFRGRLTLSGADSHLLGNTLCDGATVPAGSASMLGNWGMQPMHVMQSSRCELP